MVGRRVGAKNTLVKNYLWFAEKKGTTILPEHEVVDVMPLGAADGSEGCRVTTERPGAWFFKARKTFAARGVVFAAGSLGTNQLLANCKHGGSLPGVSDRLGELVRTNSESILTVRLPEDRRTWNDVAISCSIRVDHDTHIEFVNDGRNGDFMTLLYTILVGKGSRVTRPLMWLGSIARHPLQWLKTLWPVGWSRRMVLLLVMQSIDNAIALRPGSAGSAAASISPPNRIATSRTRPSLPPAIPPRPGLRNTRTASHRAMSSRHWETSRPRRTCWAAQSSAPTRRVA